MTSTVPALQASFLVPSPVFALEVLLTVGLLLVGPLVQALRGRRYGWAVCIVLFAPFAGLAWWVWRVAELIGSPSRRREAQRDG